MIIENNKGIYTAQIDAHKCIDCGICLDVCPGHEVNYCSLNMDIYGKKPENIFLGNYIECYNGYSIDHDIRFNSSSGGVLTQALVYALEEGIIDGALLTKMNTDDPLETEPFIARTKEEIIEAAGSKYCPVPLNIVLEEILRTDGKYAVVGLPCHINGIRKAEKVNKKLKERIILHFGLFCNHTPDFFATKIFLKKKGVQKKDVTKLKYRGSGYPGKMNISDEKYINLAEYWKFIGSSFFYPKRCLCCSDGVSELADISFGDAWLPEFANEQIGMSIMVSKSELGEQLLQNMASRSELYLEKIHFNKVIQSQRGMLYIKKKNIESCKWTFGTIPINDNILKSDIIDFLINLYPCMISKMMSPFFKNILYYVPTDIIWITGAPHALIASYKAKNDIK